MVQPPTLPPAPLVAAEILDKAFADLLGERYLAYAMSTITARSLPDVRDGLKPVHRRTLFAMRELKLEPNLPPKKSARVVGDVIGKYHPHGDVAVYEALVRLAQDFTVRYRLIDGQGNFGNIDGDNAAAMRYTEARLTEIAKTLLEGLDEAAVDFRATYDGEGAEPVVLPAAFPNLLANGASGIAVGMATSIPPHHVGEVVDALRHLIKHPSASFETLLGLMPGPDFPTGGVIVEPAENILTAYRTGRGSIRLRAAYAVEPLKQGTWQVVIKEIPYQVQKGRLIEKIAELIQARKVPLLDDVRDESTEELRIVLVPKSRSTQVTALMESLFRACDLETRFSINMNVLDRHGVPGVMNLRQLLQAFLDHRQDVLIRRTRHRLAAIEARLEILGGMLIAYLNLDQVIQIIRENDEPKPLLMQAFKLTDNQAEAILNMRLRSLRKLEEMEIAHESQKLRDEKAALNQVLHEESVRWQRIDGELAALKKRFAGTQADSRRRTQFAAAPVLSADALESLAEREPVTLILSEKGWIRAVKGHGIDKTAVVYKEGDGEAFVLEAQTTDKLLLFANNGRFYALAVDRLPKGRGFGEPLRLMLDLPAEAAVLSLHVYNPEGRFLVASSDGRGFVVKAAEVLAQTKNGKQVLHVEPPACAALAIPITGTHIAVIGSNRKLLIFPLSEVPEMAKGRGVILQRYKGATLSDALSFNAEDGLSWSSGSRTRTEAVKNWPGTRASFGVSPPLGFPKNNRFRD